MRSISSCEVPESSFAGATAAALWLDDSTVWPPTTGCCCCGSASRMSAPSPRPNAVLVIGDSLLCELRISFRAPAVNVIENNRLTETRRFRQPYVARNNALKNLCTKETAKICRHLPRQSRTFVVHGE